MSTPIIIVAGKARSGKDTVAAHIAENYNGVCIAQADPMKRYVKNLLGFTDLALWGPSEERNKVVPAHLLSENDFPIQCAAELSLDIFGFPHQSDSVLYSSLSNWYNDFVIEPLNRDGGISARVVLQTLGTEWGRQFNPKMWIESALRKSRALVEGGYTYTREEGLLGGQDRAFDYAIITDGRFRNEVLGVTFEGGAAFRVRRPETDGEGNKTGVAGHRSEKELDSIPEHFYTDTILNNATLGALYHRVDDMMAIHYGDNRRQ